MRVLFVVKSKMMENLGVMYLSAVIKQVGHECKIVDIDHAFNEVIAWSPNITGYSIMTGSQKEFKELNGRIMASTSTKTFAGGPHASFFPDDCDLKYVHQIVRGEAEQFFASLFSSQFNYIDIDSIPWADRTDFPNYKVRDFITSRGCPYDCSYCYNSKWAELHSRFSKVRVRLVEDVVSEIVTVSPEYVYFQDSCFGVKMDWMREFAAMYKSLVKKPYQCHFRPEQITYERAGLLQDSGCMTVRIALESASERLRKLIGRSSVKLPQVENASEILREHKINLMLQNIIGLPTSTLEEDLFTLETNIKCKPSYGWASIYQPYPGTVLGDMCKNNGLYSGDYSEISDSFFNKSVLNFTDEHKEKLECLQRVFALCVDASYMLKEKELTYKEFPGLVHRVVRKVGDNRLYGGLL